MTAKWMARRKDMVEVIEYDGDLVVGERTSYRYGFGITVEDAASRMVGRASGLYVGEFVDEEGASVRRFVDGEINGLPQAHFGFTIGDVDGRREVRDLSHVAR